MAQPQGTDAGGPDGRRRLGDVGLAAGAYAAGDGEMADLLRCRDDEIDDLHVSLTSELAAGRVSVPVAIEMALVARYFERLGDHAVNVARQIAAMNADMARETWGGGVRWDGR